MYTPSIFNFIIQQAGRFVKIFLYFFACPQALDFSRTACYNVDMVLPNDVYILLSVVNTALRDGESLEDFCAEYGCTREELEARLAQAGFEYEEAARRFR